MDNPIVACVLAFTLAIIAARFAIVRVYRGIDEQGKGPQKDFSTARPGSKPAAVSGDNPPATTPDKNPPKRSARPPMGRPELEPVVGSKLR